MDRHDVPGATAAEVAEAHASDLALSTDFGVEFFSYWFDPDDGEVFCFARAPAKEAMKAVHEKSHGLVPAEIIEVSENDVVSFIGRIRDPQDASELTSAFRVISFTDLVDSTLLLNRLGQAEFMVLLSEHDLIVRKALAKHAGREVKHTGDGILSVFDDVPSALDWAAAVRDAFARRDDIDVRIGAAAGEPVDHNQDIFGSAVNLANRICAAAGVGKAWVSDVVYELGSTAGFLFSDGVEAKLKGFDDLQTLYELIGRRDSS
jgi:class 3 adenylate cyclase